MAEPEQPTIRTVALPNNLSAKDIDERLQEQYKLAQEGHGNYGIVLTLFNESLFHALTNRRRLIANRQQTTR